MADSSLPDFWDTRYASNTMPWDAGQVPLALRRNVSRLPPGARILIPGCGSAYELYYLVENGFDALAIDFSPEAVQRAQRHAGCFADRILLADFFDFVPDRRFVVLYERAFLCALPRKMWAAYARRCAELLEPGGVITGFFYFDDNPKGPPFGTDTAELHALLDPAFEQTDDQPVDDSTPVFAGRERWQTWRRKP